MKSKKQSKYLEISVLNKKVHDVIEDYAKEVSGVAKNKLMQQSMIFIFPYAKGMFVGDSERRDRLFRDLIDICFFSGIWFAKTHPQKVIIKIKNAPPRKVDQQTYMG